MDSCITTSAPHHGFMLYILVTIDPSRIDEYLEHLRPIHKAVSSEPDCTLSTVSVSRETGEIRLTQSWNRDRKWFSEVCSSEERILSAFTAAIQPMWTKPRTVEFQERLGRNGSFTELGSNIPISLPQMKSTVHQRNEYLEHLRLIHKAVSEPNCTLFTETGEIRLTQSWNRDRKWFSEVQAKREYFQPFTAATQPMWTNPRTVEFQGRLGAEWKFHRAR
ncbi:hypothetical protein BDP27DRAFT_1367367 [Rhodocollybia butyracea]|uniref:ABM domain-containing protein n=1 Tax=Rhodocollybia butyracea TaxID=206335 RepID=A0A9P5PEJ8_9AGAR|nr:hypothetical protein BDP27DRAFT_1367367 [Rhodocollybia butyracea]